MWLTYWLGILIKSKVFDVENGNDDRDALANPSNYGLKNTINVIFNPFNNVDGTDRISGWFIKTLGESKGTISRASDDSESCEDQRCVKKSGDLFGVGELTKDNCVFLLLHGNAKNRGAAHRVAAYRIWQSLGCHTLTLDYRGWGDTTMSSPLGETTLVTDAKTAIMMVRDILGDSAKLIVYGHSMGTGVAARAVVEAEAENLGRVDGVILDSPFHSFKRMLQSSVLSYVFDLEAFMQSLDLEFDSVEWVKKLSVPVRIFHATSDLVTPIEGARQIVQEAIDGGKSNIDLVTWEEEGLGHIGISTTSTFRQEILNFMQHVEDSKPKPKGLGHFSDTKIQRVTHPTPPA